MKDLIVKKISCLEKVMLNKEPSSEGVSEKMVAFKGETVSFQIAYYWEGLQKQWGQVEIISPVSDCIKVRAVDVVPCEYPCNLRKDEDYLTTEPGLYPDLLTDISSFGFPMICGQWRSLWIDFEAGKEINSGEYPIVIRLRKEDEYVDVEMTYEVLNVELPELHIPHTEWFHSDCLANYYNIEVFSEKYWEIVENFVQTAVKRNCNMLFLRLISKTV